MTRIIVTSPAVTGSKYDEVALFARALTPTEIADHYAGTPIRFDDDPQDAIGWEEVYGPDYPLTEFDVPVLQNGIARVRYEPVTAAFSIDSYEDTIGWVEQGRVTIWHDVGGGFFRDDGFVKADVLEWTPERGVVRAIFVDDPPVHRAELYITLQRGWTGPRFEVYHAPLADGTRPGSAIRYAPEDLATAAYINGEAALEPWMAIAGSTERMMVMAWLRSGDLPNFYSDNGGYGGAARADYAVEGIFGYPEAGYAGVRFGLAPAGLYGEAEAHRNGGSGTTSQVADVLASGGQAVKDTQTAETAHTVEVPSGVLGKVPIGTYQVYAIVRATTVGDTLSARAGFSGTGGTSSGVLTTTSTSYIGLYGGEVVKGADDNSFYVSVWRSAGTGTGGVYVDSIALIPVERRAAGHAAYDGARDLALENLYDARAVPELVER